MSSERKIQTCLKRYGHLRSEELSAELQARLQADPALRKAFADNDRLRDLMALKAYEQPDPALEGRIRHRIRTQVAMGEALPESGNYLAEGWLSRRMPLLQYSLAAMFLLLAGRLIWQDFKPPQTADEADTPTVAVQPLESPVLSSPGFLPVATSDQPGGMRFPGMMLQPQQPPWPLDEQEQVFFVEPYDYPFLQQGTAGPSSLIQPVGLPAAGRGPKRNAMPPWRYEPAVQQR